MNSGLNLVAERLWPFLVGAWALSAVLNRGLRRPNPFDSAVPEITRWIHDQQLSGWVVWTTLRPELVQTVTLKARRSRGRFRGATYHFRSHTAIIDALQWQQPVTEWIWDACHELRHPQQTSLFYSRWRKIKSVAECGLGVGMILSIWSGPVWIPWIVVTLSAGFYAVADLIPELDAVSSTPEILDTVLARWAADSPVQIAWRQQASQAMRADTFTYLRNTSTVTLFLWAIAMTISLILHTIIPK